MKLIHKNNIIRFATILITLLSLSYCIKINDNKSTVEKRLISTTKVSSLPDKKSDNKSIREFIPADATTSSNNDDIFTDRSPEIVDSSIISVDASDNGVQESSYSRNYNQTQSSNSTNTTNFTNSNDSQNNQSSNSSSTNNTDERIYYPTKINNKPVFYQGPPNFNNKKIHEFEDRLNPGKHPENIPEYPDYDVLPPVNKFWEGTVDVKKRITPKLLTPEETNERLNSELSALKKEVFNGDQKKLDRIRKEKLAYDSKWLINQLKISRILELEDTIKNLKTKEKTKTKSEIISNKD